MENRYRETTCESDALIGHRRIQIKAGNEDTRILIEITVTYSEDTALDGDAPHFRSTGNTASNESVAEHLQLLAHQLRCAPHQRRLPHQ